MAAKEMDHYRTTLRDQWNIHGLTANDGYGVDGQPWCTAHYGFHMPLWHIPFAMTGQLHSAIEMSLTFEPKVSCPYSLPVLTSEAVGILTCEKNADIETFTLKATLVKGARFTLKTLAVDKSPYGKGVSLTAGESISWSGAAPVAAKARD
jgi:hypothetical protein